jgi:dihydrofolate reductase
MQMGLLDEIRVLINPVLLAKGKTLFTGLDKQVQLQLMQTRTFRNGNVLLIYKPLINV